MVPTHRFVFTEDVYYLYTNKAWSELLNPYSANLGRQNLAQKLERGIGFAPIPLLWKRSMLLLTPAALGNGDENRTHREKFMRLLCPPGHLSATEIFSPATIQLNTGVGTETW
jgi:hypothetical protein